MYFQAAAILYLLPVCLIPIVIHWLSQLPPPKRLFPATRFLMQTTVANTGRRHPKDLLLMIVRTLAIAAVILALAKPTIHNKTSDAPHTLNTVAQSETPANIPQNNEPPKTPCVLLYSTSDNPLTMPINAALCAARHTDAPPPYITQTICTDAPVEEIPEGCIAIIFINELPGNKNTELLMKFISRGGVIIFIPGSNALQQWHWLTKNHLIRTKVASINTQTISIGSIDDSSFLAKIFPLEKPSDLFFFKVKRHLVLDRLAPTEKLHLSFSDDTPALIARTIGKGAFFALTFDASAENTDLSLHQCFLPIFREIVDTACISSTEPDDDAPPANPPAPKPPLPTPPNPPRELARAFFLLAILAILTETIIRI